jgi:hypothetical protein
VSRLVDRYLCGRECRLATLAIERTTGLPTSSEGLSIWNSVYSRNLARGKFIGSCRNYNFAHLRYALSKIRANPAGAPFEMSVATIRGR